MGYITDGSVLPDICVWLPGGAQRPRANPDMMGKARVHAYDLTNILATLSALCTF